MADPRDGSSRNDHLLDPNAIVFGSGHVTIPQMRRAGLWLNLIGIILVTALTYAVILPVLVGS